MQSQMIRNALGQLQNDPDSPNAWETLKQAIDAPERELDAPDLLRLFDAARDKHKERGEWDAVASLLALETLVAKGLPEEPELVTELLNQKGESLVTLPMPAARDNKTRFELPLQSLAPAVYVLRVRARTADRQAEQHVPFRIVP